MKALLRHGFIFKLFIVVIKHYMKRKFNYSYEKVVPVCHSYIVLANHTTNYDPLMVGLSFPKLLYYVASDHIFCWGLLSKLIVFLVSPIPRLKASSEIQTVKQIFNRLKKGANVCIFAEGNRSFIGETGEIPDSTGKLIKRSGAGLITYRLDGGYFSNPRWGRTLRKGLMKGRKVREYSLEEINTMTVDELNTTIRKDLYVNAYDEQKNHLIAYNGDKLAENLETALYLCPCCGGVSTLKSEDDKFYCTCGINLRYTHHGDFVSQDNPSPFESVLDWSKWQSLKIVEQAITFKELPPDSPITSDEGQSLWLIDKASKSQLVGEGILHLYNNRLVLDTENGTQYSFDLDKISDMAIYSRMVLIFSTTDRESYEIKSKHPRSAVKYLELYRALKHKVSKTTETME